MVNLEWFRTFKAIYETGSLTSAANKLFISQPGVSLHLTSLETHVGYKLFDRGTRKMIPTEHGKILYNSIVEGVDKLEAAEKHFFRNTHSDKASISIGMCFETFQATLEPYISELPFDLISRFGCYDEMLSDLEKGLLDFVISPQKIESVNMQYTPFSSERIVLIAGAATDTAEFKGIISKGDWKACENWLNNQSWFGTTGDMETLRNFWIANFRKRPDLKLNYIVPNKLSIIRCLANKKGLAILPDFLCRKQIENGELQLLWEGKAPLENTLYFVHRKKTIYEKELQILKDIFIKEFEPQVSFAESLKY
ncbi:LysR family transcriptional regulator [Dysgonomonas macrotermitis]|uniref:DNA-binding transcriptional regulator, LysR family n=1 Tax=Dysgonomonas macrotermitis TaxID=1346286 RepID=A0A1M5FNA0_9BACT|nr:LysR family transcriptional regulator [Dysgonomonas macrotermitis]SHF92966.1 DNA-binding transcriptional regulator, LysR family [Dysgonomonas macrotermitis]